MQTGFFDWHDRLGKIDKNGDQLLELDKLIDWKTQLNPRSEPAMNDVVEKKWTLSLLIPYGLQVQLE